MSYSISKTKDDITKGDYVIIENNKNYRQRRFTKGGNLMSGSGVLGRDVHLVMEGNTGYVIDIMEDNKYLIGFPNELQLEMNSNGETKTKYGKKDKNGHSHPLLNQEKHEYFPSFYREDLKCWEWCWNGEYVDRDHFYLVGGIYHTTLLIEKTKSSIKKCENQIKGYKQQIVNEKEWMNDLEEKLTELKVN